MMMAPFSRWLSRLRRRSPSPPRSYLNQTFERIGEGRKIEEETLPDYLAARFYPVRIGEIFVNRYQVVGKLGFGVCSTVWLARDLSDHRHVALKVFIRSQSLGTEAEHELNMYKRLNQGSFNHSGRDALRRLSDSFKIFGPDGEHQCLVHSPLWHNMRTFLAMNSAGRLPKPVLLVTLQRLFNALDYMHNECHLIHTDISATNIMFSFTDDLDPAFAEFEDEEIRNPSPRKEVDGRFIYISRELGQPKSLGPPVLCDLGNAVDGQVKNLQDMQPDIYRSPEMILGISWSYKIDIWNVGCMIWDLYEGRHLFYGQDPEYHEYRGRAHLREMVSVLGPPPLELIARGRHREKFFTKEGIFKAGIDLLAPTSLEEIETNLEGEERAAFMQFMRKMLQWDPEHLMDPISAIALLASVESLADGAFKLFSFINTIKEGGKQRLRLFTELNSLWMVLKLLQGHFESEGEELGEPWLKIIGALDENDGVFDQIQAAFDNLTSRLGPKTCHRKVLQTLRWPFDKSEVDALVAQLERLKGSVNLALISTNAVVIRDIERDTKAIKLSVANDEVKVVLDWISNPNFLKPQNDFIKQTREGTGK